MCYQEAQAESDAQWEYECNEADDYCNEEKEEKEYVRVKDYCKREVNGMLANKSPEFNDDIPFK